MVGDQFFAFPHRNLPQKLLRSRRKLNLMCRRALERLALGVARDFALGAATDAFIAENPSVQMLNFST